MTGLPVSMFTKTRLWRVCASCPAPRSSGRAGRLARRRLGQLRDWLDGNGCTEVAMEATGVYWKPVWNILSDGRFELTLANAAHIKAVPGRKTDMNDAMWIADLVACGLIRPSYVPGERQAELR